MLNSQASGNNPNPILVALRQTRKWSPEYASDPLHWLDVNWGDMSAEAFDEQSSWTSRHYRHAHRVLSKLAAFTINTKGNTMAKNETKKTEVAEKGPHLHFTTEADTGEVDTTPKDGGPELITGWAESNTPPGFDHDQAAVHAWATADEEKREDTLVRKMTLADAEELIYTAHAVAEEHVKRARQAEALAAAIVDRLARQSYSLHEAAEDEPATDAREG